MLSDELILCTRNRPNELKACLESVRGCSRTPAAIHVVDASDNTDTRRVVSGVTPVPRIGSRPPPHPAAKAANRKGIHHVSRFE
jgi:hypothetical protein